MEKGEWPSSRKREKYVGFKQTKTCKEVSKPKEESEIYSGTVKCSEVNKTKSSTSLYGQECKCFGGERDMCWGKEL